MGLDIHVMRPKRLFLRDYELPVQRLLPDVEVRLLGVAPLNDFDAGVAEGDIVKTLRLRQLDQEQHRYVLPANNEILFSARVSYQAFNLLREFAAFFDHPQRLFLLWSPRAFGDGYDVNSLASLRWAWRRQRSRFPHLVFHEDNRGFFFPTRLAQPVPSAYGFLGASSNLRQELTTLHEHLNQAPRHREALTEAIVLLQRAAETSEQSGLPIVFDG